jgi:hypothetical protein
MSAVDCIPDLISEVGIKDRDRTRDHLRTELLNLTFTSQQGICFIDLGCRLGNGRACLNEINYIQIFIFLG